jgi:hypothetical protein
MDKDVIGSDDSLGSVTIPLGGLPQGVAHDAWVCCSLAGWLTHCRPLATGRYSHVLV